MEIAHSEACERNKEPILEHLRVYFAGVAEVLEIGSGTAQHALHFAAALPWLQWQTSELPGQGDAVRARLRAFPAPNVREPFEFDVRGEWPPGNWDAMFSANTLHIMGWDGVIALFEGVRRSLSAGGTLVVYGPFNYNGEYTSQSNADFDRWLHARDPHSGIRDFAAVQELAVATGLALLADHALPANNRLIAWQRTG